MKKYTIADINAKKPQNSKLTAISFTEKNGNRNRINCLCECGGIKTTSVSAVANGTTKSCGCLTAFNNRIHGLSKGSKGYHPLYSVWCGMKKRCLSAKHPFYHRYGGRGIIICPEWINDFKCFYDWAIDKWEVGLDLDRIDNNGNYTPLNCRFIKHKINVRNRSNTVIIEYDNKKMTVNEWANFLSIKDQTIWSRIRRGWDLKYVLSPIIYDKRSDYTSFMKKLF